MDSTGGGIELRSSHGVAGSFGGLQKLTLLNGIKYQLICVFPEGA